MPANMENSAVITRLEKVFTPIPKKGNAKESSNYYTIELISHASQVMLKILQARLQLYVNQELPDVQAGFRKGRGTRDQIANIHRLIKKSREFQKNIYFCFIDCAKTFVVWITTNCGKFSSGHRTGKGQFSLQSQRKAMPRNVQTTSQLHSSHTLVK